jgi:hypothetical protein
LFYFQIQKGAKRIRNACPHLPSTSDSTISNLTTHRIFPTPHTAATEQLATRTVFAQHRQSLLPAVEDEDSVGETRLGEPGRLHVPVWTEETNTSKHTANGHTKARTKEGRNGGGK